MSEEKYEYAIGFKSGDMKIFTDDETVEKIYPLKERIDRARLEGSPVYERKIIVVEDWVKVE